MLSSPGIAVLCRIIDPTLIRHSHTPMMIFTLASLVFALLLCLLLCRRQELHHVFTSRRMLCRLFILVVLDFKVFVFSLFNELLRVLFGLRMVRRRRRRLLLAFRRRMSHHLLLMRMARMD